MFNFCSRAYAGMLVPVSPACIAPLHGETTPTLPTSREQDHFARGLDKRDDASFFATGKASGEGPKILRLARE